MTIKNFFISAVVVLGAGVTTGPGLAQVLSEDKVLVLTCLERMDAEENPTSWGQCLNQIFAPCAAEQVGAEPHLQCLEEQRMSWRSVSEDLLEEVFGAITQEGSAELATLLGPWTGYVVQKCETVAKERAATSAEAGRLGCEITEIVGLSGEYVACLEGRSAAPYCVLAQE
ncbi:MAG: hypothetical protein AAGA12_12870 [Pseudomonadota bacterium]